MWEERQVRGFEDRIVDAFHTYATERAWIGSYRHAQMREDQYFQVADADPPPGANEDNDEENIFAEGHAED